MASTYTVDASVFLNAFNPYEAGHEESHRLLARLQERATPIIVPTLLLQRWRLRSAGGGRTTI